MKLTLPQIIMLNHGAYVNQKRMEERIENKKETESEPNKLKSRTIAPEDIDSFMATEWGMVMPG